MDTDIFSTKLVNRSIILQTSTAIARFGFILQNSISYLDLKLSPYSGTNDYLRSSEDPLLSRRIRSFINTEEKCRKFFAPTRRLLYTLHLDLPKERERSLKDDVSGIVTCLCHSKSPLIARITTTCGFHAKILSNFIEDAFSINVPKEKILERIVRVKFSLNDEIPLLARLNIQTAVQFIDCFYPEVVESELFQDFIIQFNLVEFMEEYEYPDILEYLLFYARMYGNLSLESANEIELLTHNIFNTHYRHIGPLLKYKSDSIPVDENYEEFLYDLSLERPLLTEDVLEKVMHSMTVERVCRIMQIVWIYIDCQHRNCPDEGTEALRLIWSSIPDAFMTFSELENVFKEVCQRQELCEIFIFYVQAIGEVPLNSGPRSLTHQCRTALRRTIEEDGVWIPDGIGQLDLSKSLKSFLNLEKS